MASTTIRNRYLADTVQTVPPARLVVMLYDGLVSDLRRAEAALAEKDFYVVNERLVRAQAILLELQGSLKPELWSGGPSLLRLYVHMHKELVQANITKDVRKVTACLRLVEPLADAWREAAVRVLSGQAPALRAAG